MMSDAEKKDFENQIRILCAELESTQVRLEYEREKNQNVQIKRKRYRTHQPVFPVLPPPKQ